MVKMKEQKEQKNPDLCFPPLKNPRNLNFHTRLLSTAQVSLLEVDPIINKIMISAMSIYGVLFSCTSDRLSSRIFCHSLTLES